MCWMFIWQSPQASASCGLGIDWSGAVDKALVPRLLHRGRERAYATSVKFERRLAPVRRVIPVYGLPVYDRRHLACRSLHTFETAIACFRSTQGMASIKNRSGFPDAITTCNSRVPLMMCSLTPLGEATSE